MKNFYDRDLELVRNFGREKINGKTFEKYLKFGVGKEEEEYFKIIETWMAALINWKKTSFLTRIKEKLIFLYRKYKTSQRKNEKTSSIGRKKIVFFPVGETHVSLFLPIIKKLNQDKKKAGILRYDYALDGLKKEMNRKNLDYVNFEAYLDRKLIRKSRMIRREYKEVLRISKRIVDKKEKYKRLIPALDYYFGSRNRFAEIIKFVEGIKNFIEREKPSLIFLPDEIIDTARAVTYICEKKKVPCIVMQHGSISRETADTGKTYADRVIVFGETARKILEEKGMEKNKIKITGSPVYDDVVNNKYSGGKIREIKDSLGIKNEKVILFASTWNIKVAEKRLRIFFEIMKRLKSLKMIIKQHPSEYHQKKFENFYKKLAKEYKLDGRVIISKEDMYKMLEISDIYTTDFSTTILEALILRKPIILTNFEKIFNYESFPELEGVIWHCYDYKKIFEALEYSLKNDWTEKQEKFRDKLIKMNMYKYDGKATERIVKEIDKLKLK